jgi:hypothetical protein
MASMVAYVAVDSCDARVLKGKMVGSTGGRRPTSLVADLFQTGNLVQSCIIWRYSKLAPVSWLMTALAIGIW